MTTAGLLIDASSSVPLRRWPLGLWSICLALYAINLVRSYLRLRHIPGPLIASLTNWWWVQKSVSGKGHLALSSVCDCYGPIARIGPNTVVTTDEDLIRKMNAPRGSTYTRSRWYKAWKLDAARENLFTEIDEEKHALMRQTIHPGYSGKDNPETEACVDQIIVDTVQLIRRKYLSVGTNVKPLDFAELAQYLTLDVITSLSLGQPFGFVAEDTDKYEYIASMEANFPILNFFAIAPIMSDIMRIATVQNSMIPTTKDKTGLGKAKAVARETIARRFTEEKVDRHDMVISFKNHGLSQDAIADESLFQLLAGSDTTATIIRIGFLSMLSNPIVYRKLQAECLFADIPLSSIISYARALKLPYLQACIKEALRHNPAASGTLPRIVGPQGDHHNGLYLPPGTEVAQCAWQIQRKNRKVYGEDAEAFRPERWLEATCEKLAIMEECHHLVFGFGRFRCMGENIARLELNKVFFELIRRFDWSVVDPVNPFTKNMCYGLFV